MRIIGGKYRSRRLKILSESISPSKDFLREAIFNVLGPKVKKACVLDLYAGSGSFGLEAISRGAKTAYLVDVDASSAAENLKILDKADVAKVQIFNQDCGEFVKFAQRKGLLFDLVFMDPPYCKGLIKKSLHLFYSYDILLPGGLIIAEHEKKTDFNAAFSGFSLLRRIPAGKTSATIFQKSNNR